MSEEELWNDYKIGLDNFHTNNNKNTLDILNIISEKVDEKYLQAIKEWLADEENGIWGGLEIVNKPIGEWQSEISDYDDESYWDILLGMYVNQSCGYSGDDYNGTLEIKLTENEYLRASFSL